MFAGTFAPVGWLFCDGTQLPISQYDVLYSLLGTVYGGDGQTTFNLPDLRGRIPLHAGPTNPLGQSIGTETVTLLTNQIPAHTHTAIGSSAIGSASNPTANTWAAVSSASPLGTPYSTATSPAPSPGFAPNAISTAGGSQPHDNMMPFVTVSFIIAYQGIYPTQS